MVMSERVPVYDNHVHMSPSGRNVDALREYEAAGGTGLTLVTLPYKEVRISRGEDFAESYKITYSLAEKAREATDLEINIAVGPYPVLMIPLAEAYGLERAEEIMAKGMEDAARDVAEGRAVAIGEIGRPHFPVSEEIREASDRVLLLGMRLAKENRCPVIIHCESDADTDRSLAELADAAGLDRGMVVKHSSPPLVTEEETFGVMPSIPASKTNIREAIGKGTDRFMIETDYIDDPEKPGAIMSVTTVPKKVSAWLSNGQVPVESIHRICGDIPDSLYRRRGEKMSVKVTCVYDEGAKENTSLIGARGSAMLAEAGGKKVLFDAGLRPRYLAHNLDCLGIDVQSIDAVVISQDNPDNSRGLDGVLKERKSPLPVHAPPGAYSGGGGMLSRSAGISEQARPMAELSHEEGWLEIFPGIHRTPFLESGKGYREAFLVLETPKGQVVLSGFGSGGPEAVLLETESRFKRKVHAFVGSIALEKAKKPVAEAYARSFQAHNVDDILLNHAVGRNGMTNVRVVLGLSAVKDFYAGYVYET
jgi:TatD-related deoxyribonuclease